MKKYRLTSAALSELEEATLYYEKENGLGTVFLDEIGATVPTNSAVSARVAYGISTNQTLPHASFPVRNTLSN